MSNGYNEYKKDMLNCIKYFKDKTIKAIQYIPNTDNEDAIEYVFCDLLCDDIARMKVQIPTYPEEEIKYMNVLKLQVGNLYDNIDGTYTKDYHYTLYVYENDWVVYDCSTNKLYVAENEFIDKLYVADKL